MPHMEAVNNKNEKNHYRGWIYNTIDFNTFTPFGLRVFCKWYSLEKALIIRDLKKTFNFLSSY